MSRLTGQVNCRLTKKRNQLIILFVINSDRANFGGESDDNQKR